MHFQIVSETLSDNSTVYNVLGKIDGKSILFACDSERFAHDLLMALEQVSYIEVD